jgi:hypothetical protein
VDLVELVLLLGYLVKGVLPPVGSFLEALDRVASFLAAFLPVASYQVALDQVASFLEAFLLAASYQVASYQVASFLVASSPAALDRVGLG